MGFSTAETVVKRLVLSWFEQLKERLRKVDIDVGCF